MSETLDFIHIGSVLVVALIHYFLSQIYSHCTRNCFPWYLLETTETSF